MVIRHGDMVFEIAVPQVKFSGSQIRFNIPSLHIIKYSYPRIPLRQSVNGAVGNVETTHSIHTFYRNFIFKIHGNGCRSTFGGNRFIKENLHPRIRDQMLIGSSPFLPDISIDIGDGIPTIYITTIAVSLNRCRQSTPRFFRKAVLLQMYPDEIQGFRAVVDIINSDFTFYRMSSFIQLRLNDVVGTILPVLRPRLTGGCPVSRSLPIGKFIKNILIAFKPLLPIGYLDRGKKKKDYPQSSYYISHMHGL